MPNRAERRVSTRAATRLARQAATNPLAVAQELSQHRDQIRGAYAIIAGLLRRLGDDVQTIESAEVATVKDHQFKIAIQPNGDVTLTPLF